MWTLFVGFAMLMIGNGLNLAVLGVRMVDEGFGVRTSGWVMACYFAGFLLGPVMVVRWLSGVGHIRVFASLASISPRVRLRELAHIAPTGLAGMVFTGASHGILFGLSAVYATRAGFSPGETALFLALPSIGALVFQWPVGWTSDRLPRRRVIFVVAVCAAATSAALGLTPEGNLVMLPMMFVLGGLTFPLYSLLLSHTLDRSLSEFSQHRRPP